MKKRIKFPAKKKKLIKREKYRMKRRTRICLGKNAISAQTHTFSGQQTYIYIYIYTYLVIYEECKYIYINIEKNGNRWSKKTRNLKTKFH